MLQASMKVAKQKRRIKCLVTSVTSEHARAGKEKKERQRSEKVLKMAQADHNAIVGALKTKQGLRTLERSVKRRLNTATTNLVTLEQNIAAAERAEIRAEHM